MIVFSNCVVMGLCCVVGVATPSIFCLVRFMLRLVVLHLKLCWRGCWFVYMVLVLIGWILVLKYWGYGCLSNNLGFGFMRLLAAESDLVSGFKTDYYGLSFAIIFACEYAIMALRYDIFYTYFFLIFVRAVFPRIRYDYFVSLT
ncbi:unnamed protein product [Protopolystoma xenopodis]|uniref:Uncharacterized protein n=1 Tax=Protopolystoma xenopodis TaxID=117903 RepID=A0A448WF02_9PLAT|nr:unnamed protein product [Protopolystoma xenopodis]